MPETTETLSLGLDSNPMVAGFRKAGAASRKFSEKFQMRMTSISQSARKTGIILTASLTAPIVLMGRSAVKAFQEQEDAVEALRSSLGGASVQVNAITKDFAEYAAQIQQVTVYGDELLISQAAYMKNLGVEETQLKAATKAAVGLAARYRIDLQTAAMLVGRASKGQTQMLTRYGIVMEETLTPQEKFNELLRIGADNFRLAEDAAKTTSGQMKQAANAYGDMKESIGEMIVTGLNFNKVAAKIVEVSKDMKKWFDTLTPSGRTFLATTLLITASLGPLALAISAVTFVMAKLHLVTIASAIATGAKAVAVGLATVAYTAYRLSLIMATGAIHGANAAAIMASNGMGIFTAATVAATKAVVILSLKFALFVAALKIGWELGKLIYRTFSDRPIIKERMEEATKATEKLNKEFAKFLKQTESAQKFSLGDYFRGRRMRAMGGPGETAETTSQWALSMRRITRETRQDLASLRSVVTESVATEILKARQGYDEYVKLATAAGKEFMTREQWVLRLNVSPELSEFVKSMTRFDVTGLLGGGDLLRESIPLLEAARKRIGKGGDAEEEQSRLSAKNAALAVAGSVEAYRAENARADNQRKATEETADNTAESNRLLTEIAKKLGIGPRFNSVLGI